MKRKSLIPAPAPSVAERRGLVVGWLLAQPEVAVVHTDRIRSLAQVSNAAQEARRG